MKFEDFIEERKQSNEARVPCILGEKCVHQNADECDRYRQLFVEEEHKKTCSQGSNCNHFSPKKGIPESALWVGLSPADFLKRVRGVE